MNKITLTLISLLCTAGGWSKPEIKPLQRWVLYQQSTTKKFAIFLVSDNKKKADRLLAHLKQSQPYSWYQAWQQHRFRKVSTHDFQTEYQHLPLQLNADEIALVFFAHDGMILLLQKFGPNLPKLGDAVEFKKRLQAYQSYKNGRAGPQPALHWPLQALHSNLPGLCLRYLRSTRLTQLTIDEVKAYRQAESLAKRILRDN